jgi:hypothetical protein
VPVLGVTPIDDITVPVLNQAWGKITGSDMIPRAVVVGRSVPHAPPRRVIIVVDVEKPERNPYGHIKAKIPRVEKQRRLRYYIRCRRRVAKPNVDIGPDPDIARPGRRCPENHEADDKQG